jgi:hypothetical protein
MRTELILDRTDKRVIADSWQDVEPVLEHNAALRSAPQRSDWGRHVATIPNVILLRWLNEEHARGNIGLRPFSAEFSALIARKLADPEWKHLRTDRKEQNNGPGDIDRRCAGGRRLRLHRQRARAANHRAPGGGGIRHIRRRAARARGAITSTATDGADQWPMIQATAAARASRCRSPRTTAASRRRCRGGDRCFRAAERGRR